MRLNGKNYNNLADPHLKNWIEFFSARNGKRDILCQYFKLLLEKYLTIPLSF